MNWPAQAQPDAFAAHKHASELCGLKAWIVHSAAPR